MDRLETGDLYNLLITTSLFTFQYGQIRNKYYHYNIDKDLLIYIPVWIDQKLLDIETKYLYYSNLHSSMDRLETLQTSKDKRTHM